jgi:hypothetical protein
MRRLPGLIFSTVMLAAMAGPLSATPIRPDIRKLVADPAENHIQFAPARAGWNGPEMDTASIKSGNPAIEQLSPAASARAVRTSLVATAIPDWRLVLPIAVIIVMLRYSRRRATTQQVEVSNQEQAEEGLRPAA